MGAVKSIVINIILKFVNNSRVSYKFGNFGSDVLSKFLDPLTYERISFIHPLNKQFVRMRNICVLSNILDPTTAIETGTYIGTSTIFLSKLVSKECFTIELIDEYADIAARRFAKYDVLKKITLIRGDSSVEITNILNKLNPETARVLAYLDAHWHDKLPLVSELKELINWGGKWLAIVDDFKIPEHQGYGFDLYNGIEIGYKLIEDLDSLCVLIPNESSENETGEKRGTAYIVPKSQRYLYSDVVLNALRLTEAR